MCCRKTERSLIGLFEENAGSGVEGNWGRGFFVAGLCLPIVKGFLRA